MVIKNKEKINNLLYIFIFIIVNLSIVILFYRNILLTTGLLLIIAIYSLIRWKSRRTLITFIYCALVGTIAEIICGYAGVWEYSVTNFLNIPIWLFILWGNAGAVIYQVARYIRKKRRG